MTASEIEEQNRQAAQITKDIVIAWLGGRKLAGTPEQVGNYLGGVYESTLRKVLAALRASPTTP